ncbi:LacI family DNA-binding transcriptional regulator [Limosilactobacillus fastidiosus]|uniref:LacI family DNA-binding transcriptional regulator n=1 Tax=Limosilactobacillus fastidiosus TaxID=2759855 RepID=A0A7W3YBT1_9LACO|nr:LacI family DNA-binding transcriptional regulator [Limosilactobacillus fastidiosus]MBB1062577.1 LacI family DNA-binding transcriptional regulator [Limosilactobacillus fastidiosus]MBB1085470.1 LacI family DNA-binding transcriptional regulator [Limosilactobacillus fastidiosus]MCD7083652.1 LacI family DNA-binding transcriptional regulator [Limosilactobacillus fastidiosus]MCD7085924.1 LacI family DNA-binding transcriptional regulator [Limosilactobacillus fastidiosus]MCD7114432.1 LacI family DNA
MVAKLKDVAKLAGVSVTTVSRVINNYSSLSDKTIKKVRQAMRQLNYQPNALARAMQGKPSKFIGLIFPNLTNPFFAELVNELEHQLFLQGYKTIIASSAENREIEHEYLNMLFANQVDGIISGSHNLGIEEYQQLTAPIVSFDRYLSDNIPIVAADSYRGGQLAAQFMVRHNVKRLVVIVDEDTSVSPTLNRLQGVVDYLNEQGQDFTTLAKEEIDKTPLPDQFTGVIASNDVQALKIISQYQQRGYQLNDDFFVTGYDGSQLIRQVAPQLPTVVQPIYDLAENLISTLLKRIANPTSKVDSVTLPVKFKE